MSWQERDWAKRSDTDDRRGKGKLFPDPIREDAAGERAHGKDYSDEARANRYASWMSLIDTVRDKVAACVERYNIDNPQACAMVVETLYRLVAAAHNAKALDLDTPPPGGPDDE